MKGLAHSQPLDNIIDRLKVPHCQGSSSAVSLDLCTVRLSKCAPKLTKTNKHTKNLINDKWKLTCKLPIYRHYYLEKWNPVTH